MEQLQNFINGRFVPPKSKKYINNRNPSTGEVYSTLPDSNGEDIDWAVTSAKNAFQEWSQTPMKTRAQFLIKIAHEIERQSEKLAQAESKDQGKTFQLAHEVEIPRAAQNFLFFSSAMTHLQDQSSSMGDTAFNYSLRAPLGVAGLISPWNLPLYLLTWKIAPALITGNTAVCKPSELTPVTAHMLAGVFQKVGLPPGVCNIVFGYGHSAGDALTKHPDVPLISFTGGTATAQTIVKNTSTNFKKLSLELGGKNPAIIFADANLEECVATSLLSSFQNQGEICLCNSRIFVEEKIFEEFLERFTSATKKINIGDPTESSTFMGPLISQEHREKVMAAVLKAREEGATIHTGGKTPKLSTPWDKGYFFEPTIISGANPRSQIMQEEVFGPVVTVSPFSTEEEVINLANNTKYGLSASIWTKDVKRAHRVAKKVDSATVWVNTWMLRDLRVPFGGMKYSGLGREGGKHSIDFFTEQKNICIKL